MAKKGQHHNETVGQSRPRGHERSRGNNNPSRSQTITTGSYKKEETYEAQARAHEDPDKAGQQARYDRREDVRDEPTNQGSTRATNPRSGRNGSDSNRS
jgi:hypothetical protein